MKIENDNFFLYKIRGSLIDFSLFEVYPSSIPLEVCQILTSWPRKISPDVSPIGLDEELVLWVVI